MTKHNPNLHSDTMFFSCPRLAPNPTKFILTLLKAGAPVLLGVLLSIFLLDQPLAEFFAQEGNLRLWTAARSITNIGLGENFFALSLILIFFSRIKSLRFQSLQMRLHVWGWSLLSALMVSGLALRLLKPIIGRKRPDIDPRFDPFIFDPLHLHWDYHSFPSGHTQVLFAAATTFAFLDPRRRWLWFFLAAILSFTRVVTYSHFLSDVLGGAFVGFFGGLLGLALISHEWGKIRIPDLKVP